MIDTYLAGGKMIRSGAKTVPYGGWFSIPAVAGNGWMITGDSAGFINSQRLKRIHLGMKSGIVATQNDFEAPVENNFNGPNLHAIKDKVDASEIKNEIFE